MPIICQPRRRLSLTGFSINDIIIIVKIVDVDGSRVVEATEFWLRRGLTLLMAKTITSTPMDARTMEDIRQETNRILHFVRVHLKSRAFASWWCLTLRIRIDCRQIYSPRFAESPQSVCSVVVLQARKIIDGAP